MNYFNSRTIRVVISGILIFTKQKFCFCSFNKCLRINAYKFHKIIASVCRICEWRSPISQSAGDLHKLGNSPRAVSRDLFVSTACSGRAPISHTSQCANERVWLNAGHQNASRLALGHQIRSGMITLISYIHFNCCLINSVL